VTPVAGAVAAAVPDLRRGPGLCRRIGGSRLADVTHFRIAEAARLLGVSDDTVRRWTDGDALPVSMDASGRKVIAGADLAAFARAQAHSVPDPSGVGRSARNRFVGLVTAIASDKVMSQVEMQCGPHRVVSLMSTEAVEELGLEVGSLAVSVVKASHIIVETPGGMA
jgi:molybdopterin-binding protein